MQKNITTLNFLCVIPWMKQHIELKLQQGINYFQNEMIIRLMVKVKSEAT